MPRLDNLRNAAKRWLTALREGDAAARARLLRAYPDAPATPTLRAVQHALAREHGAESWIALRQSLARPVGADPLQALLRAASRGDADDVVRLLERHPELIDTRGSLEGHSGLRTALHFGVHHEPVVRALVERGANPNIRDEGDHAFPIHFAAERGELPIVRLLVEHGADPQGADTGHELDVVGWAVCFDGAHHVDVARYLLAHGATLTLFPAVALGDVRAIRALAASGVDLNRRMDRTNHRRTPLHLAVVTKQPAAVAALLESGADAKLTDAAGLTPLDEAALAGESSMAEALLAHGAPLTIAAAIALDRTDDAQRLVAADPAVMQDNRRWARLIVRAGAHASGRVLGRLLRAAERHRAGLTIVNMPDDSETAVDGAAGYTALHAAAFAGNDDAVAVLLKHGADPRARDGKYCATPAGWARYAGHRATADLILEADVDVFDAIDGDRADRVAAILDADPAAIDRPFNAYASCGSREPQGWPTPDCTPLEWAASRQRTNAVRALTDRGAATRPREEVRHAERIVTFLQSACWDHRTHGRGDHRMNDRAAQRILAQHPEIARDSLCTAVVCGELHEATRILAARPEAARQRGGARNWTPIVYLAYTRFTHEPTLEHAVAIARLLLDHGADPNDFYLAGDARYSVLVGVAGEGEQASPRQPYAAELFDLLLTRGAEPFDIQVLYDTHFSGDMLWWLDLVYRRTIDTPRGAAWQDPDWTMFDMGGYGSGARFILGTAIRKRDKGLAEWALARGANPNAAPARDPRWPKRSLYEVALVEHQPEVAELLAQYGAARTAPALSEDEQFLEAILSVDRERAAALLRAHPEYLASPRAMFEAARRDRPDALALLLDLGFPLEAQDQTGKRALHEAAYANARRAAAFLIERGASVDPRESVHGGTPIGWAGHADHVEMIDLLSHTSRNIWTLSFRGYVDRVREILADDRSLARQSTSEGITPLWWLPDDESKALAIVDLLLACGADPSARSKEGTTATDWARRRGMLDVARTLEAAERDASEQRS